MRRALAVALAALTTVLVPGVGSSEIGPEFQVNTYTTYGQYHAAVASDASGAFVVVWTAFNDGSGRNVSGQRFDSNANPAGTEFQVNTYTTDGQFYPAVARHGDGSFVVVWVDYSGQEGSLWGVFGQRFDGSGNPAGTEFPVNTYTTSYQAQPAVAVDGSGGFVVVWVDYAGQDGDGFGVFGQRFDGSGNPAGTEFQVNTYTTRSQYDAAVAGDGSGGFVVVWTDGYQTFAAGQDGSYSGVFGQRFDGSGSPAGTEFQVNTYTTSVQSLPTVASDSSGGFVVVWSGVGAPDSDGGVFGQRFDSAGTAAGTEFQVNTYTTGYQTARGATRAVAQASDGSFAVVWRGYYAQDGSDLSVQGQRFDSAGAAAGTEFQVNTYTTGYQGGPSIAAGAGDDFVIVWISDYQDGDSFGVFGQRLSTLPRCGLAPEPDGSCRLAHASGAGKSSVQIKDDPNDSKDQFSWKWKKGVSTAVGDFKMPNTDTATYRLCIYDASGRPQPLLEADIPNGGVVPVCGTDPCWEPAGATGFTYSNDAATPNGITSIKLKAGAAGKAQLQVKGRGPLLGAPVPLSLVTDVVVQLLIDDGVTTTECFKTSAPGSSGAGSAQIVVNPPASQFKGKGP